MNEKLFLNIITNYSHTLDNRLWFVSIMRDFFPKERLAANAIIACFDIGVQDSIKRSDILDEFLFDRCTKMIINSYGLKQDIACNAVSTWIRIYGHDYLHKPADDLFIRGLQKFSFDSGIKNEIDPVFDSEYKNRRLIIELDHLIDGAKLPNELIIRYAEAEKQLGISNIHVNLFFSMWLGNSDGIRLIGEVSTTQTQPVHTIMLVSVINSKGQIVGTDFSIEIDRSIECRMQTISTEIRVPKGETLSSVIIRLIRNPVF